MKECSKRYNKTKRTLEIAGVVLNLAILIWILFSGTTHRLKELALSYTNNYWLALLMYLILFGLIFEVLTLPLDFYNGYTIEHRYRLSNQTVADWIKDCIKELSLSLTLGIPVCIIIYYLLRTYPDIWWIFFAIIFIIFIVILARLTPVIILPLFFKFKPLADEEIANALEAIARKTGVKVKGVFEWGLGKKTKKANAGLVGLGGTRRIIIADTLLKDFSKEEIEAVFAHELGHYVKAHIWRLMSVQSIIIIFSFFLIDSAIKRTLVYFGFIDVGDFANLPLIILILTLVGLLALPLINSYSRNLEKEADRFSIKLVNNPDAFISSMEKLARQNLADTEPNPIVEFIFYSHPSVKKRIGMARDIIDSSKTN